MNRKLALGLGTFFFLSGATGLVYEIVWMRQLILVFGSTTEAVSAVLSAFMLGLAVGSFALGRAADRGGSLIALYGWLEVGVGIYAFAAGGLLQSAAPRMALALGLDPGIGLGPSAVRFAAALLVLLPPTILMGGTLPVLGRLFTAPGRDLSGPVGSLYALNTLGAVTGTFLAGFALLPVIGARRTTILAGSVNLALGLAALVLARLQPTLDDFGGEPGGDARRDLDGVPAPAGSGAGTPIAASGVSGIASAPPVRGLEPSTEGSARDAGRASPASTGDAAADPGTFGSRKPSPPPSTRPAPRRAVILLVFAVSGFVAMVYEVAWSRVIGLTIGSSVYGFTLMLIAFLIGLAGGAAVFSRAASRPRAHPTLFLGLTLAGVGLASWATSLAFDELPFLFSRLFAWSGGGAGPLLAGEFALCLGIMLPATFLMGGVFPLVLRLTAVGSGAVGRSIGEAYAANTVGTVLGSAAAGFLLLPSLGVRSALLTASCLNLALAAVVLGGGLRGLGRRLLPAAVAAAACIALLVLTPKWNPLMMSSGVYYDPGEYPAGASREVFRSYVATEDEVLFYREGRTASVLVGRSRSGDNIYVKVNGKTDASTGVDMPTQILLGQMPFLFHPGARNALVIGLASGISLAAVATHDLDSIRVLEVEPAMVDACRQFSRFNRSVLADRRLTVTINDARNDLLLRNQSYDVIVSEPSNPWMTVAANLFTRDFFEIAKGRLSRGGIFCQWFQVYSLSPSDLRSLIATFRSVFPHVLVFWVGDLSDLVVLGSQEPLPLDYATLSDSISELRVGVDLGRAHIHSAEDLLAYLYLASPGIDSYVAEAPLNTDDNARIEFSAPRSLYTDTIYENLKEISRYRVRAGELLTGLPAAPAERRAVLLNLAEALLRNGRPRAALEALASAETLGVDDRARTLRSTIEERIHSS